MKQSEREILLWANCSAAEPAKYVSGPMMKQGTSQREVCRSLEALFVLSGLTAPFDGRPESLRLALGYCRKCKSLADFSLMLAHHRAEKWRLQARIRLTIRGTSSRAPAKHTNTGTHTNRLSDWHNWPLPLLLGCFV